jgi:hypothetical protein
METSSAVAIETDSPGIAPTNSPAKEPAKTKNTKRMSRKYANTLMKSGI